jgi:BirA family biotin operon repressor/biotin-[acetyl-CoA-carboxylase] ligase
MSEAIPSDLAAALAADLTRLRFFAEIDSTNDAAIAAALRGAAEGTAILAESQRAGRGRRGRDWFSPPGAGIYLSMIVRPQRREEWGLLTLGAGVAAAEAVTSATGLPVELKWPNDLVVGRPWRKLGGVLCESVGSGSTVDAVVIGVGLNAGRVAYPPEIAARATSIETELGRPVERAVIVVELLARLDAMAASLRAGGGAGVRDAWRRLGLAGLGGAPVRWHDHGTDRAGLARDIDDDGALVVESEDGVVRIVSGEVTWERLSRG